MVHGVADDYRYLGTSKSIAVSKTYYLRLVDPNPVLVEVDENRGADRELPPTELS